jgi:flagellar hook-associated protein 2
MATGTSVISGLSSGFDWSAMIDQLIAVDHKRVDTVSNQKKAYESKLSEWQSLNTKLLALKTASDDLKDAEDFAVYSANMNISSSNSSTVKAADLLSVTTSATASTGSYALQVNNLAAAQKLSSSSFTSTSSALGAGYAGDLLINGKVVTIGATDTLVSVKDRINSANSGASPTGVTASLISYGTGDNRLILTSDSTGATGISLQNGGGSDILNMLGFSDTSRTAKNNLAGGDRTDRFTSTTVSIQTLLGLTSAQTSGAGEIVVNGLAVGAVDFSIDTLSSLQTKLSAAGLTASITEETESNKKYYRLMVAGSANTYTDKSNILETLGFTKGGVSDIYGVTGDIANTFSGSIITADTLIKDIDGYTGYVNTDYIHLEGTDADGNPLSDDTLVLSDTTTVGDLLVKIESLFGDVSASITGDGKLRVIDNTTGTSPLTFKIGVKNSGGSDDGTLTFDADGNLGSASSFRKRQIVAGADAAVTVDGVTVTRSTNIIDDILSGVTLNLVKADADTTITLNIGRDMDGLMAKINSLVTSYNAISSYIHTQSSYNETTQKPGGVLFADGTLSSVKSDLTSILIRSVWGVASDYSTLGLVGVSVDRDGKLSVNDSKLRGYLTTNFNDVQKLFTANAEVSTGTLAYVSHGIKTKQGEYEVNITTAATKSTSAASDNTSLSGAEVLTIASGSTSALVNLTNGMTMTQIVNAINSELATVYTQTLTGDKPLYADSGGVANIAASTKWNSVYTGIGTSANLADGDVISFSGTPRNGGANISGSYTISDVAGDSVQGLLSAIETAYGNQVTAAINSSGKIVLTDKTSGSSSLALSFDYTQAHDLDFGTVLTSNTGGQKGRYAMDITASADAGNHLIMSHNSYGAGNSFTIHQQNNVLWTGGDQTVDNGVDVAGTINGEAATGKGQILTGNSDEANIDGLVIKYTGMTGGGFGAGTLKLTLGVAELYDRALFNITDSFEGYVSDKQKSLQDNIKRYQTRMDEMEAQLEHKREQLTNRFIKMELALQKIQSQSNWLAGQTNAAVQGWSWNK